MQDLLYTFFQLCQYLFYDFYIYKKIIKKKQAPKILEDCERLKVSVRDYMLTNELKSTDMEEWYSALLETDTITLKDISRLRLDLVLESSY